MQTVIPVLFVLAVVGALAVAIVLFLKTPAEQRFRFSSRVDEAKRREEELLSGVAVIIEAQPKKAFIRALPWAVALLPLLAFGFYLKSADNFACDFIGGVSSAYLAVISVSYVMPITLMLWAVASVPRGLKVLREGYFPPLDTVSFIRVVARRGAMSTARGYFMVALPFLVAPLIYLGHGVYESVMQGRSYAGFQHIVSEKCMQTR